MSEALDPTPGADDEGVRRYDARVPASADPGRRGELGATLPGLARLAATTWLNAAQWGVLTSLRTGKRLARALRDPDTAAELAEELGVTVTTVADLARAVASGVPLPQALATALEAEQTKLERHRDDRRDSLRERGAELLARSRDVWREEEEHPAYARILGELAPDEARVLLLLMRSGPQPSVDVRTGGPVGKVHSQLIAPGLTMIGARAGCRYVERVPAYLNNLHRLGLVWFSREQLTDPMEYQVLEAQPDVLAAMHSQRFTKVVRRSIHLTPFGEDFCHAVLLPGDDRTDYPPHRTPGDDAD
jgi:transcriptional regulator with XRE-family HTH domain